MGLGLTIAFPVVVNTKNIKISIILQNFLDSRNWHFELISVLDHENYLPPFGHSKTHQGFIVWQYEHPILIFKPCNWQRTLLWVLMAYISGLLRLPLLFSTWYACMSILHQRKDTRELQVLDPVNLLEICGLHVLYISLSPPPCFSHG